MSLFFIVSIYCVHVSVGVCVYFVDIICNLDPTCHKIDLDAWELIPFPSISLISSCACNCYQTRCGAEPLVRINARTWQELMAVRHPWGGNMLCFPPQACSLPSGYTRISAARRRHACRYTSSFQPEVPLLQSASKRIVLLCLWCLLNVRWLELYRQTDRKTMQYKCHVLEIYWMHQNISKSILLTLSSISINTITNITTNLFLIILSLPEIKSFIAADASLKSIKGSNNKHVWLYFFHGMQKEN